MTHIFPFAELKKTAGTLVQAQRRQEEERRKQMDELRADAAKLTDRLNNVLQATELNVS